MAFGDYIYSKCLGVLVLVCLVMLMVHIFILDKPQWLLILMIVIAVVFGIPLAPAAVVEWVD